MFFVGSVGVALGREGPTHCLCVCLGQVRVFEGSVCSFVGSVGVALGRERPTHCLCVCLGQMRVFEGSVCSLWVLWVLPLGEKVPHMAFVCVWAKCVCFRRFSVFFVGCVCVACRFLPSVVFHWFLLSFCCVCVRETWGRWLCPFFLVEAQYNTTEEGGP